MIKINFKKAFICFLTVVASTCVINTAKAEVWMNDAKSMFTKNRAIVLAINIRTFNAEDKNNNDIIDANNKDTQGTFTNGVKRLDELVKQGINTVLLMPVMQTGKLEAKGTAGSLYAPVSFTQINTQFEDKTNKLNVEQEMTIFIEECHKRKIHVLVDIPAFGAYDLYKNYPDLFMTDKNNQAIYYGENTDTRVFKVVNGDGNLHQPVYNLYSQFIKKMLDMNVDGVRAQYATTKPTEFWRKLIESAKRQDPEFLFIADVSHKDAPQFTNQHIYTSWSGLLDAGFDTYYGGYADYGNWKTASNIEKEIEFNAKVSKKYADNKKKSVLATFAPQNATSPYLELGESESSSIAWIAAALPANILYVDGFQTGDIYDYKYANKRAQSTLTDSKIYYVDNGQIDIYNFSRKPGGKDEKLQNEFIMASNFKVNASIINTEGYFKGLRTFNRSVISYANIYKNSSVIILWNTDKKNQQTVKLGIKGVKGSESIVPLRASTAPAVVNGKIHATLQPNETMVILGMNLTY